MESQIEKMYKNAGVEKINAQYANNISYHLVKYPLFTAEKQLELFKLIANRLGYPDYEYFGTLLDDYVQVLNFDEALAKIVNNIWQDLTDAEKAQIKNILE